MGYKDRLKLGTLRGLSLDPMPGPLGSTSCQVAALPVEPGRCMLCP